MFKVTISSKYRATISNKLKNVVDAKFINAVQDEVIDGEIKRLIRAGVSPVDGLTNSRRFTGYKTPEKYPGDRKAKRPVSLYLSGLMLSFYKATRVSGSRFLMGIAPNAPQEVKVRAVANNIGTVTEKGQVGIPARPFIPVRGETYRVSVLRKIKNLYAKRVKDLLSS